jgi:hypothetical protein
MRGERLGEDVLDLVGLALNVAGLITATRRSKSLLPGAAAGL